MVPSRVKPRSSPNFHEWRKAAGRQGHEAGQGAVLEDEIREGPSDLKVPREALALEEGVVQMGRAPEEPVEQGQREGLPRGVGEPRVGHTDSLVTMARNRARLLTPPS